jgi:hypothetical protein
MPCPFAPFLDSDTARAATGLLAVLAYGCSDGDELPALTKQTIAGVNKVWPRSSTSLFHLSPPQAMQDWAAV